MSEATKSEAEPDHHMMTEAEEVEQHNRIQQEIRARLGDAAFGASKASVALHEAGHAVVGNLLGFATERVYINQCGPELWGGEVVFDRSICSDRATPAAKLLASARVSLAGLLAEDVLGGGGKLGECIQDLLHAGSDIGAAARKLGVDPEQLFLQVAEDTKQLVLDHAATIRRVAAALEAKLNLDAAEVADLLIDTAALAALLEI